MKNKQQSSYIVIYLFLSNYFWKVLAEYFGMLPESKEVSHYNLLENRLLARLSGYYFRKYP